MNDISCIIYQFSEDLSLRLVCMSWKKTIDTYNSYRMKLCIDQYGIYDAEMVKNVIQKRDILTLRLILRGYAGDIPCPYSHLLWYTRKISLPRGPITDLLYRKYLTLPDSIGNGIGHQWISHYRYYNPSCTDISSIGCGCGFLYALASIMFCIYLLFATHI